jgi:DNA replication protein DnaC
MAVNTATSTDDMLARALHLPSVGREYARVADIAAQEQWSYEQYLHSVLEAEMSERQRRRIERLLHASHLPDGKALSTLDRSRLPAHARMQVTRLLDGTFASHAENVLVFGLPGRGKTHLVAAVGRELIMRLGLRVLFLSTYALVQDLLRAKAELRLERQLARLDHYEVIIIDDIGYVQQSRDEMEVLFTFLAERYERRSLMITSNLVFSQWDRIFKDPMTTAAAIDRLVHHSIIIELTGESYRMEQATRVENGHESAEEEKRVKQPKNGK